MTSHTANTAAPTDAGSAQTNTRVDLLLNRLMTRIARVAVIGLGYVGLPLAETFAAGGYTVIGFDIDAAKVDCLKSGRSYIGHIDAARIQELIKSERFEPTCAPECLESADAIVICVPTPLTKEREPDLSFVVATGKMISRHLCPGQLVVLESTTYPGTTDDVLRPILEECGLVAGKDFFLAYSPEREDPGNAHFSTRRIPKVVGGMDADSRRLALALYEPVVVSVVPVSDNKVAEACKILENTYRAVNIALVNELKIVFDAMGINIWEVIAAAKTKPFGFQAFYPGPGLGGHCIPIDPFYLTWAARRFGINTRFIELAGEVNTAMPKYVVGRIADSLNECAKPIRGSRICILGVAYKKDVDDARESPAFEIMELLKDRGAIVTYNDPFIPKLPSMRHHSLRGDSQELTPSFLAAQDCVVIVTDHSCYDMEHVARHARLIVDTRNGTHNVETESCRICRA
jgi:UDP-N-acetyl-D-glucosamine dehydrogenase